MRPALLLLIGPLMETIVRTPEDDRYEPWMALAGISHRIGRDALLTELGKIAPPEEGDDARAAIADRMLSADVAKVLGK